MNRIKVPAWRINGTFCSNRHYFGVRCVHLDQSAREPNSSRFVVPKTPPEKLYKPIKLPELPAKSRIVFEQERDDRPEWAKAASRRAESARKWYYGLVKANPFLFYGAPFLITILVSAYYLQEFTEIRYKTYDEAHKVTADDLDPTARRRTKLKNESKEDYYARNYKMFESAATEDYEIKRVERRPEDPPVKW